MGLACCILLVHRSGVKVRVRVGIRFALTGMSFAVGLVFA